ncbi:hypothetical protein [Mucilaginibacter sp. PAMB04168]|uniref:hypothetical protein n=1 Tax=Mucilaginibacter sp. PAMB04168 TaxID=3138567 RepID=UPI0031F6F0D3
MVKTVFLTVFLFIFHYSKAQLVEFAVTNQEGKPVKGVALSKYNVVAAVSDSSGYIRIRNLGVVCRLHMAGYRDTSIVIKPGVKDVVLKRSGQALKPIILNYASPLQAQIIQKNSSFNVTSIDSTKQGDTIVEKVTRIDIEAPSVVGLLLIPVTEVWKGNEPSFEFVLYEDNGGKPGNSVLVNPIKGLFHEHAMVSNLFDEQIVLKPGHYFVGYRRKVGSFYRDKIDRTFEVNTYTDRKASKGAPTFKKVNNADWLPVLMPGSKPEKPKYYSFAHIVQLVKHN